MGSWFLMAPVFKTVKREIQIEIKGSSVIMGCCGVTKRKDVILFFTWWLDMETISVLQALCERNTVTSGFSSHRASYATIWCFLCCWPYKAVKQTVKLPVIWNIMPMWHHCYQRGFTIGNKGIILSSHMEVANESKDIILFFRRVTISRKALISYFSTLYGSGHKGGPLLLPGFAIIW